MYLSIDDNIYSTIFVSGPNPFCFRFESVVRYIRIRIRNRSIFAPIRIWEKYVVKDNGISKIRPDPFTSLAVPVSTRPMIGFVLVWMRAWTWTNKTKGCTDKWKTKWLSEKICCKGYGINEIRSDPFTSLRHHCPLGWWLASCWFGCEHEIDPTKRKVARINEK
jgi:hypothetical protein